MTVREMAALHYENELRQDDAERFNNNVPESVRAFERDSRSAYENALRKLVAGVISDEERDDGFEGRPSDGPLIG